jgi:hypothetical protein
MWAIFNVDRIGVILFLTCSSWLLEGRHFCDLPIQCEN